MEQTKCKIIFILTSLCMGGAEKHVISLLNRLDSDVFDLHLCYLKDDTLFLSQINQDKLQGLFYGEATKKIDFKTANLLARYVDEQEIDIIVSTNMYPMIYAALARFLAKRQPLMVEVLHSTHLDSFRDKMELLFYRSLFRAQHRLIYVSENQRIYWRKKNLHPRSDCVIHNGINADYFTDTYSAEEKLAVRQLYGFEKDDYVIGICAELRPEKAHTDLLKAVKNLNSSGIAAKCMIIGDGGERPHIEQQIVALNLEKQAKITGYQQDVRKFIVACDVVAIVSHAVETFSIAALEAMSLGKPMVMSEIGGAAELVNEGSSGYLFPAGDVQALENSLLKLNNKNTQAAFGLCGREIVVTQFTEGKMIQKFHNCFLDMQKEYMSKISTGRLTLLGIPFDNYSVAETLAKIEAALLEGKFIQHSVINVAKLVKMREDKKLYDAVTGCDIVNIDGMGVVWGARFLGIAVKERVAGIDLFFDLLSLAEKNQHSIYLLGAKQEVLVSAISKLHQKYPSLKIAGSHHGYFGDDEKSVVEDIKRSGAAMLFVAITSPKKELFIDQWGNELGVNFVMGVGGTFDIVAGITKRSPEWMQKAGLEWFYRVLQEPERMWKRYLVTNSQFLWALGVAKIKQWVSFQ